MSCYN